MGTRSKISDDAFMAAFNKTKGHVPSIASELGQSKAAIYNRIKKMGLTTTKSNYHRSKIQGPRLHKIVKSDFAVRREDRDKLAIEYSKTKNPELKEKIVLLCRELINSVLSRVSIPRDMYEDCVQEAYIRILTSAIDHYDHNVACTFTSYVQTHIFGAIKDCLRKVDHVPRLERHKYAKWQEYKTVLQSLLGHEPSDDDMLAYSGMICPDYRQIVSLSQEMPVNGFEGFENKMRSRGDCLEDRHENEAVMMRRFKDLVHMFSIEEQVLLFLYYFRGLQMARIGELLGLSESRISQIHSELIRRLRLINNAA